MFDNFVTKPNHIKAVQWDGTAGSAYRILGEVFDFGGKGSYTDGDTETADRLVVNVVGKVRGDRVLPEGWIYLDSEGWHVEEDAAFQSKFVKVATDVDEEG